MRITYEWRAAFDSGEVDALHAEAFGHRPRGVDWFTRVKRHSLGWVCARQDEALVGFVNVAWDGGAHAFILDMLIASRLWRRGVGTDVVAVAVSEARAAGCRWLHVDFEDHLRPFYVEACGFRPTSAGLIAL